MEISDPIISLVLRGLFSTLALLCFGSFFWSVIGVFRKPDEGVSKMYRVLQVSSAWTWFYSMYAIFISKHEVLWAQVLAFFLICFSLWVFWKTRIWIREKDFALVFNDESPSHLETNGPFRWVRHPFYSSYLLCYFSVFVFTLDPLMAFTVAFMVVLYLKALRDEERKFHSEGFSESYRQYSAKTGALFPRVFERKS